LVLALESSSASKPSMGASGASTEDAVISVEEELHSCCCLLPCPPECSRNRNKTQSDVSSSSSLSALHAALLGIHFNCPSHINNETMKEKREKTFCWV
jgi:hypothetical protein